MKRKVIQVGNSTQLVSLPKKWCDEYHVKKGDELNIELAGASLVIRAGDATLKLERRELDLKDLSPMILRCIVALYKKGVDEIRITYDDPSLLTEVQRSIGKEAVGFEIVEQGATSCIIKQVGSELGDFDSILRRTFLLLISMATEIFNALEKNDLTAMKNIAFLEEANNRFTTTCRRMLNKKGHPTMLVGPLYYIIEDLENIADEFKYLCQSLYEIRNDKSNIKKQVLMLLSEMNEMIKDFYSSYYTFDKKIIARIGKRRKTIVADAYKYFTPHASQKELIVLHHILLITQKVFCLTGPYLVLAL